MLLIFAICAVYRAGAAKRYWLLAVLLFLLSETNAFGFLIAIAIAVTLVFELLVDRNARAYARRKKFVLLLSGCIVLTGLATSTVVMKPKSGGTFYPSAAWTTRVDLNRMKQILETTWQAVVPIKVPERPHQNTDSVAGKTVPSSPSLWNSVFLSGFRALAAALAVLLLCFMLLLFAQACAPDAVCLVYVFYYDIPVCRINGCSATHWTYICYFYRVSLA